jgi:hypothetical protein
LFIVNNVDGINRFSPESEFVKPAEVFKKWPNIPSTDPFGPEGHLLRDIKFFSTNGYESLEKFIEDTKGRGLSHIFVDGRPDRSSLENNLFLNEKSYPYLIKEFDSIEHGLKYHVKIFKIDYDIFENSEYNE